MLRMDDRFATFQRRVLLAVGGAYLLVFLLSFAVSLFTFPAKFFLAPFRPLWTLHNAFVGFMSALLPVHCTAVLVSYSFAPALDAAVSPGAAADTFSRLIKGTLVTFLVLTLGFAMFHEVLLPLSHRALSNLRYRSQTAVSFLERAERAVQEGNLETAETYLDYYRSIDPANRRAAELRAQLFERLSERIRGVDTAGTASQPARRLTDRSPADLIAFARHSMEQNDYFSAYYYATFAYRLAAESGRNREDARRLSAQAWEMISTVRPSDEEQADAALFDAKRLGVTLLSSQSEKGAVDAYFLFSGLAALHPADPDVRTYLNLSTEAAAQVSFFLDEAESMVPMPGVRNIFFVNIRDEAGTELIHIGKLVRAESGTYLQDVDIMSTAADGSLRAHVRAPLAELLEDTILLRGIDADDPARRSEPEYVAGRSSIQELPPAVYRITPSGRSLEYLRSGNSAFSENGLVALWEMADVQRSHGYTGDAPRVESIVRASLPFTFFILSLLSVAVGWRLRFDAATPPVLALLLIPGFPFVVNQLVSLYRYVLRLIQGSMVLAFGTTTAVAAAVVAQTLILLLTVIYLAGTPIIGKSDGSDER